MQITIYPDLCFLINFLMDLYILMIAGLVLKQKLRPTRILVGAMVAATAAVIYLLIPGVLWKKRWRFIGIGISLLMVRIAFDTKGKNLIEKWVVTMTVMLLMGGIVYYFLGVVGTLSVYSLIGILLLIGGGACCFCLLQLQTTTLRDVNATYLVIIKHGTQMVVDFVYLDTGNMLWDPLFGKPVIVLDEKLVLRFMSDRERKIVEQYKKDGYLATSDFLVNELQKKNYFHEISFQSVGNPEGKMLCLLADEIRLCKDGKTWKRQPIALASPTLFEGKTYHGLLNRELM